MTPVQISKAAESLLQAEKSKNQIKLLTADYPDMTMDDAFCTA